MYPQYIIYVLSKNMKIVKTIQMKTVIFTAVKSRYILHGHVFVINVSCLYLTFTWKAEFKIWL